MQAEAVAAYAPGRVNLIGEHTDYNDGLCLPFALDRGVTVTARPTGGEVIEARALDFGEEDRFAAGEPEPAGGWRAFVRGSVAELGAGGHPLGGALLEVRGDVPPGAGLGSSGALGVALALALLGLSGGLGDVERLEVARLCSRVENRWVGAQTGLLDQMAALFGREGHALRLDMATLEAQPVPLELRGWSLVAVDSGERHRHADSGYNRRRAECRAACEALGIRSLREARREDLGRLAGPLDRRVRHVLTENERVDAMVGALRSGDLAEAGRLIDASHASLRDDYEASVRPVEETVARLRAAGAAGTRIVGGGFGGQVLALFPPDASPPEDAMSVRPGAGAGVVSGGAEHRQPGAS